MKPQFYIYVHCRPSGEPFYIGKGCGQRAYNFSGRGAHHRNIVAKYGKTNILVHTYYCKSEYHAFACEVWMIAWCVTQKFRLANKTTGGDGVSGWCPSVETRALWRKQRKGRLLGNRYNLGRKHSAKTLLKMSAAQTVVQRNRTSEHRKNQAAATAESNRNRAWTEEMRLKAAQGSLGNVNARGERTPEQCIRNSIAQKAWRQQRTQL